MTICNPKVAILFRASSVCLGTSILICLALYVDNAVACTMAPGLEPLRAPPGMYLFSGHIVGRAPAHEDLQYFGAGSGFSVKVKHVFSAPQPLPAVVNVYPFEIGGSCAPTPLRSDDVRDRFPDNLELTVIAGRTPMTLNNHDDEQASPFSLFVSLWARNVLGQGTIPKVETYRVETPEAWALRGPFLKFQWHQDLARLERMNSLRSKRNLLAKMIYSPFVHDQKRCATLVYDQLPQTPESDELVDQCTEYRLQRDAIRQRQMSAPFQP